MIKVCVITGGRMDYGHLYKVISGIKSSKILDLQIIATCMHLSPEYGNTYKQIVNDGFKIDKKVECLISSDTSIGISKSVGLATISFADAYEELKPNIILIAGDRFELLAAAQAALFSKIPIAHIAGGDTTEGAFDESIRHSITKMSHIHFVTNETAQRRVCQMGENPDYVFNFGSPTIDYIKDTKFIKKSVLESKLNFKFLDKNILFTYHPVTLPTFSNEYQIKELIAALKYFADKYGIIITKSNADNDGYLINKYLEDFSNKYTNVICFDALGQFLYYNLMNNVDCMVGNSSSGLYEMPYFNKPTLNIGERQNGRDKAISVIDCSVNKSQIIKNIEKCLNLKLSEVENPYGNGHTSTKIVNILENLEFPFQNLQKKFYDFYG